MRPNRRWVLAWAAALAASAAPAAAQQTTLHAQVRPRYELRDPLGGGPDEFTSMRVRLGLEAALDEGLSIFAQVQDVRLWGEETSPLSDFQADNLDLHQGYIRYEGQRLDWMTATIGRMEATFGGERLVGPVDWTQQGQAFDGVRVDIEREGGTLALVAYRIGDETAPSVPTDVELYGAYGTVGDVGSGDLDVFWLFDRTEGATVANQHTVGARYVFTASEGVEGRLEGSFQTGSRGAADVAAYMFGVRVGRHFLDGDLGVTVWYDHLSGDDASSPESEAFHTLYATNHKFYGLADLFLNVPAHTGGAGLQDTALKLSYQATDEFLVGAELHTFLAARQGTLSGIHFGDEIDVTASHRYSEHLTATAGFSYVLQNDPLAEIGRLDEDLKWFYVMLSAAF